MKNTKTILKEITKEIENSYEIRFPTSNFITDLKIMFTNGFPITNFLITVKKKKQVKNRFESISHLLQ